MNSLSHIVRSFNRFELKYVVSLRAAAAFKEELARFLVPDDHGGGAYLVSSLYYDSPDLLCYWEKSNGVCHRRKLRIRHYGARETLTPDTHVYVEIKQRLNRVTQKRRILLPYREALNLCDRRQLAECDPDDRPVVEEVIAMAWRHNLRPTSLVQYYRQAFVGTDYDVGLRVTFDTDLRGRSMDLDLASSHAGYPISPPHLVIVEIKVNDRIPYWLTELVAQHNFRQVRISKYCKSLEASGLVRYNGTAHPLALAFNV